MSTELAVQQPASVPMEVTPDILAALGLSEEELSASRGIIGMENARPEDFQIPRLQIAQAMSPQLLRSKAEYIPNLMVGQFFNTVTQEIYGDTFLAVPVKYNVTRLRFITGAGLDCQSKNAVDGGKHSPLCSNCPYSKWGSGKDGVGTDCKEYWNWLLINVADENPISLSFKSSSLVVAKTWLTLTAGRKIQLGNGQKKTAPAYMTVYELRTVEKSTPKGTFYIPAVRVINPAPAQLITIAAALHKAFKGELSADVSEE